MGIKLSSGLGWQTEWTTVAILGRLAYQVIVQPPE